MKRTCSVPERLEAEQLAARDAVWKDRPVADLSSTNLFNHFCDLNLRTETWPDLTSHQNWQIILKGKYFCQNEPQWQQICWKGCLIQDDVRSFCYTTLCCKMINKSTFINKSTMYLLCFYVLSRICCVLQLWEVTTSSTVLKYFFLCISMLWYFILRLHNTLDGNIMLFTPLYLFDNYS